MSDVSSIGPRGPISSTSGIKDPASEAASHIFSGAHLDRSVEQPTASPTLSRAASTPVTTPNFDVTDDMRADSRLIERNAKELANHPRAPQTSKKYWSCLGAAVVGAIVGALVAPIAVAAVAYSKVSEYLQHKQMNKHLKVALVIGATAAALVTMVVLVFKFSLLALIAGGFSGGYLAWRERGKQLDRELIQPITSNAT